jgi:hypothetical protein
VKVAAAEWALAEERAEQVELTPVVEPAEVLRNTAGPAPECRKAQVVLPIAKE